MAADQAQEQIGEGGGAPGPQAAYQALVARAVVTPDPAQRLAVEKLEILHRRLARWRPDQQKGGLLARLGLGRSREEPPQGLYIYGAVGRGKSMLMDLFFKGAPVTRKRRVHFHAFMQDVHRAIFGHRQMVLTQGAGRVGADPIPVVARQIAAEAALLCFDEFQVTDVADAMILGRLFTALWGAGVVVVATSNRPPRDLYQDGLNRPLFLPFIALLEDTLDVLHLDGAQDWRMARLAGRPVYFSPLGRDATAALDEVFLDLTRGSTAPADVLTVLGHPVTIPRAAYGVARAAFGDLCGMPLGPADFLAVARAYHTLVLDDVPRLGPENRNEAKRFVTLVDALYEARVKLVVAAAAPPDALYPDGDGAFEFQRTASRLHEMQSADYLASGHGGA